MNSALPAIEEDVASVEPVPKVPASPSAAMGENVRIIWAAGLTAMNLGLGADRAQVSIAPRAFSEFYVAKGTLGRGAFGVCSSGFHRSSKTPCAVKIVNKELSGIGYLRRFVDRDMASTLLQMSKDAPHPNVVAFLDFVLGPRYFFCVKELLTGPEFLDHVIHHAPVSDAFCQRAMFQTLSAAKHIHSRKIIHRDVKLENFKFRSPAAHSPLVMLDFGLCCLEHDRDPNEKREIVGTRMYMAPEVLTRQYNCRVDLWSLGIVMYIMLAGKLPFDEVPPWSKAQTEAGHARNMSFLAEPLAVYELQLATRLAVGVLNELLVTSNNRGTAEEVLRNPFFTQEATSESGSGYHRPLETHHRASLTAAGAYSVASPVTARAPVRFPSQVEDFVQKHKQASRSEGQQPAMMNSSHLRWLCSGNAHVDKLLLSFNDGNAQSAESSLHAIVEKSQANRLELRQLDLEAGKNPTKCPKRHDLQWWRIDGAVLSHTCDGCNREILALEHFFRCHYCDFDHCQACYHEQPAPVVEVATEPLQLRDDGRVAQAEAQLQCHMLFSSPLCISHAWQVKLDWSESLQALATETETETFERSSVWLVAWGISFDSAQPGLVRSVDPGGWIASWNARQQHEEMIVTPGDELWQLEAFGVVETLDGRPVDVTLRTLASRVGAFGEAVDCGAEVHRIDLNLMFRGLRAMKQLQVEQELANLRSVGCQVHAHAATAENICSIIATGNCQILHFALHCAIQQEHLLILEDRHGKAHVLRSEDFRRLLTRGQQPQEIRVAFLNSCGSYMLGKHFIAVGVQHVVCIHSDREVRDDSCLLFSCHFFRALCAGRTVTEAFSCGVAVLSCSQEPFHRMDSSAFVLLPENAAHDETFATRCASSFYSATSSPLYRQSENTEEFQCATLPASIEDFTGREVDLHCLLHFIGRRRFVEILGEPGSGKSTVLAAIGRFLSFRHGSFQEILWLDETTFEGTFEGSVLLEDLRNRSMADPQRRILLLADCPKALDLLLTPSLLRLPGIHIVTGEAVTESIAARVAVGGLKHMRYPLNPLAPIDQAKLFLRRLARPLYQVELEGGSGTLDKGALLPQPTSPAKFLELATSPLLARLRGNARDIVNTALKLSVSAPPCQEEEEYSTATKNEARETPIFGCATVNSADPNKDSSTIKTCESQRKARLQRPDGKAREEWLPKGWKIDDVLENFSPEGLQGNADVFISGFRAQPCSPLADFSDDENLGLLVLEFREKRKLSW